MPYKDKVAKAAWMRQNRKRYDAYDAEWTRNARRDARLSRPFIGVDGEGITRPDGTHDYVMLCASTGEYIAHARGLYMEQCIRFLLNLKASYPNAIFVGFGFNYDSNMILKSKGLEWINNHLLNPPADFNGYTRNDELGGYLYVDWKPRKTLTLKLARKQDKAPGMVIYDTFGFFQSSFYKALSDNGIGDVETLRHIQEMKAQRSEFHEANMQEMLDYSILECKLLAELMEKLRSMIAGLADTDLRLNLPLSRWDGAGAIAAELLKYYGVKGHRWPLDKPQHPAILAAYFGGRFESPMLGMLDKTYSYDINSAYPEAMLYLPCLKEAELSPVNGQWDGKTLALCRVRWSLPGDTIIAPFPFRDRHGRISFPVNGQGWYWSHEVTEAIHRFGSAIELLEVWQLRTRGDCMCSGQPFGWIAELYEYRRKLKAEGDARQLPLKLGYNSCYGKLAQGVGHAPFQDFIWAGLITSYTRGKILAAIYRNNAEKYVAQIATDGIEFTRKQPLVIGEALGQWEYGEAKDVFIAGNGLVNYTCPKCLNPAIADGDPPNQCKKCDGRGTIQKVRGFGKGERINWQELREEFLRNGPGAHIMVSLNRFIGASLAIHLQDKSLFCKWVTQDKTFTAILKNRTIRMQWGKVSIETGGRMPARKKKNGRLWLTEPIGAPERESFPHRPKSYKGELESPEELALLLEAELSPD